MPESQADAAVEVAEDARRNGLVSHRTVRRQRYLPGALHPGSGHHHGTLTAIMAAMMTGLLAAFT